jgi:hypothetical protein
MKRIMLLMVGIFMALVVAAPMVSARSNREAPEDASGTVVVNPGDYPGSCEFSFNLEFSGKARTIYSPISILHPAHSWTRTISSVLGSKSLERQ